MNPFNPVAAATVNISVSNASQRVSLGSHTGIVQVRVMNNGTATAWIDFGGSAITASTSASVPIGPGATEVLTTSEAYVAAIAAASTGSIYFTMGAGI